VLQALGKAIDSGSVRSVFFALCQNYKNIIISLLNSENYRKPIKSGFLYKLIFSELLVLKPKSYIFV
jgi:hypothetical protein